MSWGFQASVFLCGELDYNGNDLGDSQMAEDSSHTPKEVNSNYFLCVHCFDCDFITLWLFSEWHAYVRENNKRHAP
jgi:hypothetical protein